MRGFTVLGKSLRCGMRVAWRDVPNLNRMGRSFGWHDAVPHETYTIMLLDVDATDISPVRHYVVTNVRGQTLASGYGFDTGDVLQPLCPINPPPGDPAHRYVFVVYTQRKRLDAAPLDSSSLEAVSNVRPPLLPSSPAAQLPGCPARARARSRSPYGGRAC